MRGNGRFVGEKVCMWCRCRIWSWCDSAGISCTVLNDLRGSWLDAESAALAFNC